MGQGTESCNGYDVPYEWQRESDLWAGRYDVGEMSVGHLKRSIQVCRDLADCATFSDDAEVWREWEELLESELDRRPKQAAFYRDPSAKKPVRGRKLELVCHCGNPYEAKVADLKRGYGKSCCKRCSAVKRTYGRPNPKTPDGKTINQALKEIDR